ncbi:MAG: hypothetical protein IJJ52_04280 [Lachnospiraceae bacterium]|nr:hypothetical protein [Lachnospiraceae bacterium]
MINSTDIPVLLLFGIAVVFAISSLNKYFRAKQALSAADTLISEKKREISEAYRDAEKMKTEAGPAHGTGRSGRSAKEWYDRGRTVSPEFREKAGGASDGLVGTGGTLGRERTEKHPGRMEAGDSNYSYEAERPPKPDLEPVILFQCLPLTDYWHCPVCCAKNHIRKSRTVCEACGGRRTAG